MVRTLNVITLLSDLLHNWETGQRRQVHDYLEAPSSDFYEPPADQYGPPQDHYGPPQDHYGPPQDHYGPPQDHYGPPSREIGRGHEYVRP